MRFLLLLLIVISVGDISSSSLLLRIVLATVDLLFSQYEVENYPFKVCKELSLNFDGDSVESVDYFLLGWPYLLC